MLPSTEKNLHRIFIISIFIKGVDGILEILGGLILGTTGIVGGTIATLTEHELSEDPHDAFAAYLQHLFSHGALHVTAFGALYLLVHGIIKVFLVAALLKNKLWAYPASIVFLILFILYQIYRFTFTGSLWLVALTIFDALVLALVFHEYRHARRRHGAGKHILWGK